MEDDVPLPNLGYVNPPLEGKIEKYNFYSHTFQYQKPPLDVGISFFPETEHLLIGEPYWAPWIMVFRYPFRLALQFHHLGNGNDSRKVFSVFVGILWFQICRSTWLTFLQISCPRLGFNWHSPFWSLPKSNDFCRTYFAWNSETEVSGGLLW